MPARVMVFVDYQNVHLSAHDIFQPPDAPVRATHVDPARLGRLLVSKRRDDGDLTEIRVYRGRPNPERQPRAAQANDRQANTWASHPEVTVVRRVLRYPAGWPVQRPQEKGIDVAIAVDLVRFAFQDRYDVGILVSRDTDLLPALEAIHELKLAHIEVATWVTCSRLRFPGTNLPWCHYLSEEDYRAARDPTDYTLAT